MNKVFNLGEVNAELYNNGTTKGFILKRKATIRECKYILANIFYIDVLDRDSFTNSEEYTEYNNDIGTSVNKWLTGEVDDDYLVETYAYDCTDESLGLFNILPLIVYLKEVNII